MNLRGQAGLEYLMTYGWALIIIATIVGVLTFLVSSPTGKVACTSSDPAKILLKSGNIIAGGTAATVARVINVQNATGGALSSVSVFGGTGLFNTGTAAAPASFMGGASSPIATDDNVSSVVSGGNLYIFPAYTAAIVSGANLVPSSIIVGYKDQFNYDKYAVITCQGKV